MKTLHETLQDYLAIRRGLGFKFQHQERRLSSFISFLEQRGAAYITVQLALEWATQPPDRQPSWALRLTDVRGFARYLRSTDPRTEVPPTGLLAFGGRITPYLYSQEEIRRLLAAAKKLPPSGGLRRWTYHCLFGLLAVTGLRISEALALEREDIDLDEGLLTIRDTKFGKTRLVALHESTQSMMTDYAERRDAHLGALRSPYFLVAEQGGRVWAQHVYPVFHQLSRQIGLRGPSDHTGPRLHDFRHHATFRIMPSRQQPLRFSRVFSPTYGRHRVFKGGIIRLSILLGNGAKKEKIYAEKLVQTARFYRAFKKQPSGTASRFVCGITG